MKSLQRVVLALALALAVAPFPAHAVPVTLVAENNPIDTNTCIYAGTGACTGIGTPTTLLNGSATDLLSAAYTVGDLTSAVGGNLFQVDIRMNQNTQGTYELQKFELLIDNVVAFNLVPVPQNLLDTVAPAGTAEYAIRTFDLSGFSASQAAQFRLSYANENAGAELFFLQAVPEPSTLLLVAGGFLAMAGWRRYLRNTGADSRC